MRFQVITIHVNNSNTRLIRSLKPDSVHFGSHVNAFKFFYDFSFKLIDLCSLITTLVTNRTFPRIHYKALDRLKNHPIFSSYAKVANFLRSGFKLPDFF